VTVITSSAGTTNVLNANVPVLDPAETSASAGVWTAALLLESVTLAPPAGAGPLSVTVPLRVWLPAAEEEERATAVR
jgi:hypothetical protein